MFFRKNSPPRMESFTEEEWAVLILALECLLDHGSTTLGPERFQALAPTVQQLYEELQSCTPPAEY